MSPLRVVGLAVEPGPHGETDDAEPHVQLLLCESHDGQPASRPVRLTFTAREARRLHALLGDSLASPLFAAPGTSNHPDSLLAARARAAAAAAIADTPVTPDPLLHTDD